VSIDPDALLSTVTGEAFQPVRLYYEIPNGEAVTKAFKKLACMDHDRRAGCWVWLYEREAARLRFGMPRESLPAAAHPIVIGRFHLHEAGTRMFLAVRSNERAFEAAKFFGSLLGSKVSLIRVRLVNRWFKVDFPLHAEDATPGLDDLKLALRLRQIHAHQRWLGSHVSLFEIIRKAVAGKGGP
jgi:hypothetical protein